MIRIGAPRILDGKECFDLWNKLGSLQKVAEEFKRQGLTGKNGKGHPTTTTVANSAWRYVLNNLESARSEMEGYGIIFDTDREWNEVIVTKATYILGSSRRRFFRWIDEHNLWEYGYVFETRMGKADRTEIQE